MRTVVTYCTVVAHPETSEDVTKTSKAAGKYKMPVTQRSGGTSLEGISEPYDRLLFVFLASRLLNRGRSLFLVGDITCIDSSGMDEILKIHCVLGTTIACYSDRSLQPEFGGWM